MSDRTGNLEADPWSTHLRIGPGDPDGVELDLSDDHLNFLDGAHGGAVFSLAEAAVRRRAVDDGVDPLVIDAHFSFTSGAAAGDRLRARAVPSKTGRSLGVYRVSIVADDDRLVGEMTATVRFAP